MGGTRREFEANTQSTAGEASSGTPPAAAATEVPSDGASGAVK